MVRKRWSRKQLTHLTCGSLQSKRRLNLNWMLSCGVDLGVSPCLRILHLCLRLLCIALTHLSKTVMRRLSKRCTRKFQSPDWDGTPSLKLFTVKHFIDCSTLKSKRKSLKIDFYTPLSLGWLNHAISHQRPVLGTWSLSHQSRCGIRCWEYSMHLTTEDS